MNEILMIIVRFPRNDSAMKEHEQNQCIVQFLREMACIRERLLASDPNCMPNVDTEIAALEKRTVDYLSNTLGIRVSRESLSASPQDSSKKSLINDALLKT